MFLFFSNTRLIFLVLICNILPHTALVNEAQNKPTMQSSLSYGGYSSRAVDGNTDRDYESGTCSHTSDKKYLHWWCVDLLQSFNMNTVKIYNRANFAARITGFEVRLALTGGCNDLGFASASRCYKDKSSSPKAIYAIQRCNHYTPPSFTARYVYIGLTNTKNPLTLCEVEIYTENCPVGFCGGNCGIRCHDGCLNNTCDKISSKCMGCKVGYYGDRCDETCGTCNGTCRQLDGICKTGCQEGYWGPNGLCLETCSYCTTGGCRVEDGVCYNGCTNGTQHPKCIPCSTT